jgi:hypothetical protein
MAADDAVEIFRSVNLLRCVGLVSMPSRRWCQGRGSSMVAIVQWLKMMTCLRLVAVLSDVVVFSQDSGMMIQGSGDLYGLWLS